MLNLRYSKIIKSKAAKTAVKPAPARMYIHKGKDAVVALLLRVFFRCFFFAFALALTLAFEGGIAVRE